MFVAENFIKSLVEKYRRYTVYIDGVTLYDETCNVLSLKHYLHNYLRKVCLTEIVNQYFKYRTGSFDM